MQRWLRRLDSDRLRSTLAAQILVLTLAVRRFEKWGFYERINLGTIPSSAMA
jgi:hypothetical protein